MDRMVDYLAFRHASFAVRPEHTDTQSLLEMARFNFVQATGRELGTDFALPLERAVIADAQMMPHAWARTCDRSELIKLDCAAHGDNHFFPGPVDAAWDVAGAIVEWEMDADDADYFVRRYISLSRDDVRARLDNYLTAYAAFRNGYCRMASASMAHDAKEESRLVRDADRYKQLLEATFWQRKIAVAAYE
jgi:hypothetical protein